MKDKFRKGDNDNLLFVTSRCSNKCIMCCQPPSVDKDYSSLFAYNMHLIESADPDTDEICITGGEPTLIGDDLFKYMDKIWSILPNVSIHILTNGRVFSNVSFLGEFLKHIKGKISFGIPIHADNFIDHDFISGAHDSFFQTLEGLHNLGKLNYNIELRVILIKQNVERLSKMAEFITLNLPFVSQVSFMGLEIIGFAYDNFEQVFVHPSYYMDNLSKAIFILKDSGMKPYIFNLPLCLLPESLWFYSCKSISNWKVKYASQCKSCFVKSNCCGLFSTSQISWDNIKPIHL